MEPELSAEFHLTSPLLPLVGFASSIPNPQINLIEILRTKNNHTVLLCWISADAFEEIETALDEESSIAEWAILDSKEDRRLFRLQISKSTKIQVPIEEEFIERGATPIHATVTSEGWKVRAIFPDRTFLTEYRESCKQRELSFSLERLYHVASEDSSNSQTLISLTTKQREALLLAFQEGYYEIPRKTDLAALGERLDISERSVSDRLRRAQHQLIENAVTNERIQP